MPTYRAHKYAENVTNSFLVVIYFLAVEKKGVMDLDEFGHQDFLFFI